MGWYLGGLQCGALRIVTPAPLGEYLICLVSKADPVGPFHEGMVQAGAIWLGEGAA